MPMARQTGACKWFDAKKGIGFISPDDSCTDIFVHHSAIQTDGFRKLVEGEKVEFDVSSDDRGRHRAIGVKSLGAPAGGRVRRRRRQVASSTVLETYANTDTRACACAQRTHVRTHARIHTGMKNMASCTERWFRRMSWPSTPLWREHSLMASPPCAVLARRSETSRHSSTCSCRGWLRRAIR